MHFFVSIFCLIWLEVQQHLCKLLFYFLSGFRKKQSLLLSSLVDIVFLVLSVFEDFRNISSNLGILAIKFSTTFRNLPFFRFFGRFESLKNLSTTANIFSLIVTTLRV